MDHKWKASKTGLLVQAELFRDLIRGSIKTSLQNIEHHILLPVRIQGIHFSELQPKLISSDNQLMASLRSAPSASSSNTQTYRL